MSDELDEVEGDEEGVLGDGSAADRPDEEIVEEFVERRGLDDESWIEDGEKYRCPECEAVHDERGEECRVCGWEAGDPDGERE